MKTVVLFADGFEEIEGLSIVDILRRADIPTEIIGISRGEITGAHGLRIIPDGLINQIDHETIEAVFLPGGSPGYLNLASNENVIELIKNMNMNQKLIGAICASPYVLAKAGVLFGKKATIYPGMEDEIITAGGIVHDDIVVIDQNIVTSQGPATSISFSLTLVELLTDKKTKDNVKNKLLTDKVFKKNV